MFGMPQFLDLWHWSYTAVVDENSANTVLVCNWNNSHDDCFIRNENFLFKRKILFCLKSFYGQLIQQNDVHETRDV